jgi:hypothetical protein
MTFPLEMGSGFVGKQIFRSAASLGPFRDAGDYRGGDLPEFPVGALGGRGEDV